MYNNNARKKFVDELFFKDIDTEEKAYWLGFIQADGCIYQQDTTYRFQINLAEKDITHLELFNNTVSSSYTVSKKNVQNNNRIYKTCTLKINSKPFCEALMEHGIEIRKSLKGSIPQLRDDLVRHYIRGFFDGDGCINLHNTRVNISFVGGRDFLEELAKILSNTGINFSEKAIQKNSRSQACSLKICSRENTMKLYDYLYTNSTTYLSRKHEKFTHYLSPMREIS